MFIIKTFFYLIFHVAVFGVLGGLFTRTVLGNFEIEMTENDATVLMSMVGLLVFLFWKPIRFRTVSKNTALGARNDYWKREIPETKKTLLKWRFPGYYALFWYEIEEGETSLTNTAPVEIEMDILSTGGSPHLTGSFVISTDASSNLQLSKFYANGSTDAERMDNCKKQMLKWIKGEIQAVSNGMTAEEIVAQKENFIENMVGGRINAPGGLDEKIGVKLESLKTGDINLPGDIEETLAEIRAHRLFAKEANKLMKGTKKFPGRKVSPEKAWNIVLTSMGKAQMILGGGRAITHSKGGDLDT